MSLPKTLLDKQPLKHKPLPMIFYLLSYYYFATTTIICNFVAITATFCNAVKIISNMYQIIELNIEILSQLHSIFLHNCSYNNFLSYVIFIYAWQNITRF